MFDNVIGTFAEQIFESFEVLNIRILVWHEWWWFYNHLNVIKGQKFTGTDLGPTVGHRGVFLCPHFFSGRTSQKTRLHNLQFRRGLNTWTNGQKRTNKTFIHNDTQWPPVTSEIVTSMLENLRCDVIWSSDSWISKLSSLAFPSFSLPSWIVGG